jgi:predicted metal-binding protein
MFGCNSFGKKSCPPNVPDFDECVKFVKSYKKAILFRFRVSSEEERGKALQFMLDAERESLVNHSFAFAVFPGSCNLCDSQKCHENCHLARPSLSALCIDASKLSLGRGEMAGILLLD